MAVEDTDYILYGVISMGLPVAEEFLYKPDRIRIYAYTTIKVNLPPPPHSDRQYVSLTGEIGLYCNTFGM